MKLKQIASARISSDELDARPQKFEHHKSERDGSCNGEGPQLDGRTEGTDMSIEKNYNTSNGSLTHQEGSVASDSDDCSLSKENHFKSVGPKNSMYKREVNLVALENEISDLNDRLEALEADHVLLEHMLNSLRNGQDGPEFIQEIAHQLHELRKIVLEFRW
ncbi:hypothetical protein L6164_034453 [Bauhinia variegata]|nr:hypothetical protein L6164_034453 [Bauhinia variegata]